MDFGATRAPQIPPSAFLRSQSLWLSLLPSALGLLLCSLDGKGRGEARGRDKRDTSPAVCPAPTAPLGRIWIHLEPFCFLCSAHRGLDVIFRVSQCSPADFPRKSVLWWPQELCPCALWALGSPSPIPQQRGRGRTQTSRVCALPNLLHSFSFLALDVC